MRRKQLHLYFLISVLLVAPATSEAQQWSGIIAPSRAIDWSNAGIPAGIPNRSTICATLNPGVTSAQINSAIASCPSGQVVFLTPGTYNLSAAIDFNNHSNVTVRGAGADQTFLVFGGNTNCFGLTAVVCIRNGDNSYGGGPSNTANWTSGYSRGTTSITLDNTSNLVAGRSIMVLDQLNDSNIDTGSVWVCDALNVCSSDGTGGGYRSGRAQSQMVLVTAISGNTVTISPGLYMPSWSTGKAPQAWWPNSVVMGDGLENLSMDDTSAAAQGGVLIYNGYGNWVKGVREIDSNRNHVWLFQSMRNVVRDSYFAFTQNSCTQSYGVEGFLDGDDLVENNIFQHVTAPMIMSGAGSGNVWGYNFSTNDYYACSTAFMQQSNWLHSAGISFVLVEGNQGAGLAGDMVHGTHHFVTAFRNQWIGWETGKTNNTNPVGTLTGNRYFNLIGNVLGKPAYHTLYQAIAPSGTLSPTAIYLVGLTDFSGCCTADSLVASTLMRWGNYDVVNAAPQWNLLEIPNLLTQFANPVPSGTTLPASLYLSSKPSWWGTMPWPAIGPDVTGGSDPTGHAYPNPAQTCYNSSSMDASYSSQGILAFNASFCYGQATAPSPPTNLTIVVH